MFVDIDLARESLLLDADSGYLLWKNRPEHHFKSLKEFRRWNGRYAGTRAGSLIKTPLGYQLRRVKLGSKNLLEHHVVWALHHNTQPPLVIDHINRNGADNRPRNLRDGDSINHLNMSRYKNNQSGVVGVHWDANSGKWKAQGSVCGKRRHLGLYSDLASAESEVLKFRASHGYTAGHGAPRPNQTNKARC